jgi:hypothetical protein
MESEAHHKCPDCGEMIENGLMNWINHPCSHTTVIYDGKFDGVEVAAALQKHSRFQIPAMLLDFLLDDVKVESDDLKLD